MSQATPPPTPGGDPGNQGNPGISLDGTWLRHHAADEAAIHRRGESVEVWNGPEGADVVPALLRVLAALDLTTLSGDDTGERVTELCRRAVSPLPGRLEAHLSPSGPPTRVAAVCVFPAFLPQALDLVS